ncbi:hypothetical protein CcCBS67573_g04464 [Chytriomyces confervae]|uniref:Protein kinase domain-containing protein n=1 Tax=Chytriomyces confervae TaxID=246404 RepID=A0A507FDP9_9FUNG|nr:hypothetical protein CcCBS67573_g04464 [Chytriomyces confervae]
MHNIPLTKRYHSFRPIKGEHTSNFWAPGDRVCIAKDRETGSDVMIKRFDSSEDPSNETRNYQINLEACTLRELSNLNPSRIVTFISFHHEGTYVLLAMEMARCSLEEALSGWPTFTESKTKGVVQCVLEALVTCHSNGIAHRNVTPKNLFLIYDNLDDLKLGGFDKCAKDDVLPSCIGFEGYMAPEQMGPLEYGRPVDIWAAGVIAYQLFYGSLPYLGLSAAIHTRDKVMPKLQFPVNSHISKEASEFMQLLLSDNPDDRPSASQALQHPWLTGVTHAIPDDSFSKIWDTNPSGATQTIVPRPVATNYAPIKKLQQDPIVLSQKSIFEISERSKSTILGTNNIPAKEKPDTLSVHDEAVIEIPASDIHIDNSKPLGKGSFGIVYAATYKTRKVAVKCIFGLDSAVAYREFEHEARQMSRLKHKNIVPMLGISFKHKTQEIVLGSIQSMQESDAPMLVMECMSTSVYSAIGSIPPPPMESRVRWVRQTASAFCYLHHECDPPVLHLDLKPNNILIDSNGNAQLADFGLACIQRMTSSYTANSVQSMKHGAQLYAPPESFKLKYQPTTKHDVYCFAMTSYHILGLHPPFHDKSNITFSHLWVQEDQKPEQSEKVEIPDDCWTLIVKCWDHDAAIRPNFIQIMDSIESWITGREEDKAKLPTDEQNHFWDMLHIPNRASLVATPPETVMASPQIWNDSSLGTNNSCNKNVCSKCGKAVDGPHITFEGKKYHHEHFSCEADGCDETFSDDMFVCQNGKICCPLHHFEATVNADDAEPVQTEGRMTAAHDPATLDTYQFTPDHIEANLLKYKLAVVGDAFCGKTCLQRVFTHQSFSESKYLEMFETYTTTAWIEEIQQYVKIEMHDCGGLEDFDQLRPLSYEGANIVLLAFSVDSPTSFANVWEKWLGEIKYYLPKTPIFLVALKIDLRTDTSTLSLLAKSNEYPITTAEGKDLAQKIGAMTYLECSALTGEGVNQVYKIATHEAVRSAAAPPLVRFKGLKMLGKKIGGFLGGGSCLYMYPEFIRSQLEYGLAIRPLTTEELQLLQKFQNTCLRILYSVPTPTSIAPLHLISSVPTIQTRNLTLNAAYFYRLHQSNDTRNLTLHTYRQGLERDHRPDSTQA